MENFNLLTRFCARFLPRVARGLLAVCVLGPLAAAAQPADNARRGAPPARNGEATTGEAARGEAARPPAEARPALPADATTHHKITLAGQSRDFTATAGTIRLFNADNGAPQADLAYIAFRLDGVEARQRPVSFVFNGGPGYASAWLNLGGLGPWRLPMDGAALAPSAPPGIIDNPDTWLEFTDLVFIDPAGTGYSRVLGNEEVRKSLWSVNGDIASLSVFVRRWVEANGRGASPKFIVGESYGGFRAPKIARNLQTDQGIGVAGLVMISPVLDFSRFDVAGSPFQDVARLPAYAASARERKGAVTRDDLQSVEAYAAGEFLVDLVKGVNDKAAVARISKRVSDITGLDPGLVERAGGRVPVSLFLREINRGGEGEPARVSSPYDASVTTLDAEPTGQSHGGDDAFLNGLHAPITQAMVDLYRNRLNWTVENGRYLFVNEQIGRNWEGRNRAEAVSDLRRALALDPNLRVLATHGLTDLVTPYFETKMVLDQIPDFGAPQRLRLVVYPGGHMSYTRDATRKAMREDARKLVEGEKR